LKKLAFLDDIATAFQRSLPALLKDEAVAATIRSKALAP
jgi:hypothetical protein